MKSILVLMLLPASILLIGCADGYRYPCQNPENWDKKICQKPFCSANGTCPEDLTHYEKSLSGTTVVPNNTINKGDCKC
jgi:hypothetical protein